MTFRGLLFIIAISLFPLAGTAQVDVQLTQYYDASPFYNPGATGVTDRLNVSGGTRLQWVGVEGAPKTFFAFADMPLPLPAKGFGGGVTVQHESLGLYRNTLASVQFSWGTSLFSGRLTGGLRFGVLTGSFRGSEVVLPGEDAGSGDGNDSFSEADNFFPKHDLSGTSFDAGVGLWYNTERFFTGVALLHLNKPVVRFSDEGSSASSMNEYEFSAGRSLNVMAGGNIPIKNTLFEVIPSVFLKTDFHFTTTEVTARCRYRKFLSAGLSYRHDDSVAFLLGVEFKNFTIGYSYDYPVSEISRVSSGSHEIIAGYRMKLDLSDHNKYKYKSIRIM